MALWRLMHKKKKSVDLVLENKLIETHGVRNFKNKSKRIPSIFKDESTRSCICFWKLAVAVATYVSICIVYRILPSFAF
jgi:hypothetical protein